MSTELATLPNNGDAIMALIQQAASSDSFDVAKMKEVLDLKREWDRDRAAEAYSRAITQFQEECKPIKKDRKPSAGPQYTYASFDDVMRVAGPILTKCGLAVTFSTSGIDKGIRVTCRVRHGTHFEDHTLDIPIPDMRVNDTQRYGAALSYAKRYALCAALNIVVTDEDNDAAGLGETISEEDAIQLQELIDAKGVNPQRFLEWAGVEKLADLPLAKHQQAIEFLKRKR